MSTFTRLASESNPLLQLFIWVKNSCSSHTYWFPVIWTTFENIHMALAQDSRVNTLRCPWNRQNKEENRDLNFSGSTACMTYLTKERNKPLWSFHVWNPHSCFISHPKEFCSFSINRHFWLKMLYLNCLSKYVFSFGKKNTFFFLGGRCSSNGGNNTDLAVRRPDNSTGWLNHVEHVKLLCFLSGSQSGNNNYNNLKGT